MLSVQLHCVTETGVTVSGHACIYFVFQSFLMSHDLRLLSRDKGLSKVRGFLLIMICKPRVMEYVFILARKEIMSLFQA